GGCAGIILFADGPATGADDPPGSVRRQFAVAQRRRGGSLRGGQSAVTLGMLVRLRPGARHVGVDVSAVLDRVRYGLRRPGQFLPGLAHLGEDIRPTIGRDLGSIVVHHTTTIYRYAAAHPSRKDSDLTVGQETTASCPPWTP